MIKFNIDDLEISSDKSDKIVSNEVATKEDSLF